MAETRRMHYVPRTYLEKFAQERNREFYIHALNKQTGKIISPNVSNICVETDFYLLEGATEKERQVIENLYNEFFESDYSTIYEILTDQTRDRITLKERYDIIGFVVSMFYRNNVWNLGYNRLMDETFAKAYHLSKANEKDTFFFGEQEISIAGKSLEELQNENKAEDRQMIAVTAIERIFQLIRMRVINDVVTIVKTKEPLLTSDNPVSFRSQNLRISPIPMDATNTLSIPIDSYHLLQLQPWGDKLDNDLTMLGRTEFSLISAITSEINNQQQYRQSERFLLGTEDGIRNFQLDVSGELFKKKLQAKFSSINKTE